MLPRDLQFHQRVVKHIDRRRFFGWFLAWALPWAVAMSLFIQWHNDLVEQVRPVHHLIRLAVGFVSGSAVVMVVHWKAIRPAMQKALAEGGGSPT